MDRLRMVRGKVRVPDSGAVAEAGPATVCQKCRGSGWVYGCEIDDADAETSADTETHYSCPECRGMKARPSGTEARVIADIVRRQREGIAKYGCTVEENPLTLREWLQHAYEEALDLAVYLRRAIEQLDHEQR